MSWFDGFRPANLSRSPRSGKRESLVAYTARELRRSLTQLELATTPTEAHPLKLPDLEVPGVRVFVRLLDERMRAYRAPVVEVVALDDADWRAMAYPKAKRTVDAIRLKRWLSQVYPPGVMERTNPQTKKVYLIDKVQGSLSLEPSGASDEWRYALLRGEVRLTDEGPDNFEYGGRVELVLAYSLTQERVRSIRGTFDGFYPRRDRARGRVRQVPLQAAVESLPFEAQFGLTGSSDDKK